MKQKVEKMEANKVENTWPAANHFESRRPAGPERFQPRVSRHSGDFSAATLPCQGRRFNGRNVPIQSGRPSRLLFRKVRGFEQGRSVFNAAFPESLLSLIGHQIAGEDVINIGHTSSRIVRR